MKLRPRSAIGNENVGRWHMYILTQQLNQSIPLSLLRFPNSIYNDSLQKDTQTV